MQINAVIDPVNFFCGLGTLLDEQLATVVAHCDNERSFAAHFAQQFVAANIKHEVLRVRREAESDFADLLDEERGVGRVPSEMHMKMRHATAGEVVGEKKRVARASLGLEVRAVSRLVLCDESGRPSVVAACELRHRSDDSRRRRVANFRLQIRPVPVAKAREWRIDRADFQVHTAPLQRQHLSVAKCLRDYGIPGIEIAKPHRHQ